MQSFDELISVIKEYPESFDYADYDFAKFVDFVSTPENKELYLKYIIRSAYVSIQTIIDLEGAVGSNFTELNEEIWNAYIVIQNSGAYKFLEERSRDIIIAAGNIFYSANPQFRDESVLLFKGLVLDLQVKIHELNS